jgi:hypothetical protein
VFEDEVKLSEVLERAEGRVVPTREENLFPHAKVNYHALNFRFTRSEACLE